MVSTAVWLSAFLGVGLPSTPAIWLVPSWEEGCPVACSAMNKGGERGEEVLHQLPQGGGLRRKGRRGEEPRPWRTADGVGVRAWMWEPSPARERRRSGKGKARCGDCGFLRRSLGSSCHQRGVWSETPARLGNNLCCPGGNAQEESEACGVPASTCLMPTLAIYGLLFTSLVRRVVAVTSPPSWFPPSYVKLD